jgi:hypothetical protein
MLIEILRYYLPAFIFALICAVTVLLFRRTHVKGYLAISIGFAILAAGFVVLKIIPVYLIAMFDVSFSYWYLLSLYFFYGVIYSVPALLILLGFIYIHKENKPKSINKQTPPKDL